MSTSSEWDGAFGGAPIGVVDDKSPEVMERRARRRRRRSERNKRRDIQGLRMVAVVAVVINHLTGHPKGGFVGVDVFFVISGFLITSHLLREADGKGRISLLDFYRRRIRRLFPAALTVTVATVVGALIIFGSGSPRYHSTWVDAIWATLFSANWRFISTGTDYFAAFGGESPLQHYWSLSVEEQFYLVWPLTLIVAVFVARRLLGRDREHGVAIAGSVAGVLLCGLSLAVAAYESDSEPVRAYFSTFTRGWELGLGALLAVLAPYVRGGRRQMTWLSLGGLAIILVSLFVVNQDHFPFPGALLPCLGSAMVISAKSRKAAAWNPILTNRLSNYIGDISYSIYVVHLPVIVLAEAALNKTDLSLGVDLALAPTMLGLSMLLFHTIEDPIRNSRWLEPRKQKGFNVTAGIKRKRSLSVAGVAFTIVGVASLTLAIQPGSSSYADLANQLGDLNSTPTVSTTGSGGAPAKPAPKAQALAVAIRAALLAQSYPKLTPPFGDVNKEPPELLTCGDTQLGTESECSWGSDNPQHWIYLVGDSTSVAYTNAFRALVKDLPGWRVRALGGFGCGFGDRLLAEGGENQHVSGCPQRNADVLAAIQKQKPDVLVVTNVIGTSNYVDAERGQLRRAAGDFGKVVFLPAPPKVISPDDCYSTTSAPVDCVGTVPSVYASYLQNDQAAANEFDGTLIDPTPFYCLDTKCPIFVGTTPTRRDQQHTTPTYSTELGPIFLEALRNAGVLPG